MISSFKILAEFLKENDINIRLDDYLKVIPFNENCLNIVDQSIIQNIIVDAYKTFSEEVKQMSLHITSETGVYLGRQQKKMIYKMINYDNFSELKSLESFIGKKIYLKQLILRYRKEGIYKIENAIDQYFKNLRQAINDKNKDRIFDYLNFIYSRLLPFNEYKFRSISELFEENRSNLLNEFDSDRVAQFEEKCREVNTRLPYSDNVKIYNDLYLKELTEGGQGHYDIITINLNQNLFDSFNHKENFYSYIFELISSVYKDIRNHRSLILKIENIIYKGMNLKWELYSYLTVYAENFKSNVETRSYYKPDVICFDFLENKYGLEDNKQTRDLLKDYYKNKIDIIKLNNDLNLNLTVKDLDFFREIYNSLRFKDCLILKTNNYFPNSLEIDFIKNQTELLLIFTKHEIDDRKIPCPVCSSIKISGNSYPEVGIKSWECKNNYCSERSKTNRGKRYSIRSIEMQNGLNNNFIENIISKDLISKWRKDVVQESSYDTLYEMIVRYFSYHKANALFLNFKKQQVSLPKDLLISRNISFKSAFSILGPESFNKNCFNEFISGEFIKKFIYASNQLPKAKEKIQLEQTSGYNVSNEDCLKFLNRISNNSIHHMVTSPPYYNARDYSQWKNLYSYLHEMYNVCQASYKALCPGGVFFYNIGDIFDNPNTIVKSKMGRKKNALGAYLILLFKKAGFELLDNIIWDKGETQSNRHKNDGNYTPYYQRPANSYEHMFIFKKPGNLRLNEEMIIDSNVKKFPPVIKINSKGENIYGHTAPFPSILPHLSIMTFTKINDIVFDPFLGSGTTVYTAVKNKRIGLGTEMNEDYFKLANVFIKRKLTQISQLNIDL